MTGIEQVDAARKIIAAHPSESYFSGGASEEEIKSAEALLGLTFPPSYRHFLACLGSGGFCGFTTYGITKDALKRDQLASAVSPNMVGLTLELRTRYQLSPSLVHIYNSTYGPLFFIDTSIGTDECPVIEIDDITFKDTDIRKEADSFGAFFLKEIEATLED